MMGTLKLLLEKPVLIWVLISVLFTVVFMTGIRETPLSPREEAIYSVTTKFAESSFPPRLSLMREMPDWGHIGYYAIAGRLHKMFKGDVAKLRAAHLSILLLGFLIFVALGFHFTYRNRLNPLWISLALMVFAGNPYSWLAGFQLGYLGMLVFFMLLAAQLFEKERFGWSSIFLSLAVLVDWRALLLAVAFVLARLWGEHSRLVRPERLFTYILPFLIAALPILAWHGVVPKGEVRTWWHTLRDQAGLFRLWGLFYVLALFPIYPLFFTWTWGLRARSRAVLVGSVVTAALIPLYFIFPIQFDLWAQIRDNVQLPLGYIDQLAWLVAGPYKNFFLFIPWLVGTFLFAQMLLMDVLDRSRWLRFFIILFFAAQPFVVGVGDAEFLIVLPLILLFSLSEGLVGEQGKLA